MIRCKIYNHWPVVRAMARAAGAGVGFALRAMNLDNIIEDEIDWERAIKALHDGFFENEQNSIAREAVEKLHEYNSNQLQSYFWAEYHRLPLRTACLLGALRRYRTLFRQKYDMNQQIYSDYRPYSRENPRPIPRHEDLLLTNIERIIYKLQDYEIKGDTIHRYILMYERAMIERLNNQHRSAIALLARCRPMLKRMKTGELVFGNTIHQLATFDDPTVYVDFQIRLTESRLGGPVFRKGRKRMTETVQTSVDLMKDFDSQSPFIRKSRIRFFVHQESLFRREWGDEYTRFLNSEEGKEMNELFKIIVSHYDNNRNLVRLTAPKWNRSGAKDQFTTEQVKKEFSNNLEEILNVAHNDVPDGALKTKIKMVGDLSELNPFNAKIMEFDNLHMFQRDKSLNWFETIHTKRLETSGIDSRFDFTMLSMSAGIPWCINWSNAIADSVFVHSLRVEKLKNRPDAQGPSGLRTHADEYPILLKSTGQLDDLTTEFRNSYPKNEKEQSIISDFLIHFHNSNAMLPFLKEGSKKPSLTKTMKVSRIMAIGKGLRAIFDTLNKHGSMHSDTRLSEQTLAERYNLMVCPNELNPSHPLSEVAYQLVFVTHRLSELVDLLDRCRQLVSSKAIAHPYRTRLHRVLEKYTTLLGMELEIADIVLDALLQYDVDFVDAIEWTEVYIGDITKMGKKGKPHPMFDQLKSEARVCLSWIQGKNPTKLLEVISVLINQCDSILATVSRSPGKELTQTRGEKAERRIEKLRKRRIVYAYALRDRFSGNNILTTQLITARLVQNYVDIYASES